MFDKLSKRTPSKEDAWSYRGVQLIRTMEIGKKTVRISQLVRISRTMYVKFFDKIMDFSSRISDNFWKQRLH